MPTIRRDDRTRPWWFDGLDAEGREGIVMVSQERGDEIHTTGEAVLSGWIPGRPAGKPSVRGGARGRRGNVWALASRPVKLWKLAVERQAREVIAAAGGLDALGELFAGDPAVGVAVTFVFPSTVAERHGTEHTAKPDADNLLKLLFDVWVREGLLGGLDDADIAAVSVTKAWGATPGAGWSVRRLGGQKKGVEMGDRGQGAGDPPWWAGVGAPDGGLS